MSVLAAEDFYPNTDYGTRKDNSKKGSGYFGALKRPNGKVSTEITIGVDFGSGEMEIPTLVPTLSRKEIEHLLSGGEPDETIVKKAVEFAKDRLKNNKPLFAQPGEEKKLPDK
jgi:hypothetical protein